MHPRCINHFFSYCKKPENIKQTTQKVTNRDMAGVLRTITIPSLTCPKAWFTCKHRLTFNQELRAQRKHAKALSKAIF